ncbi:Listeria-Bacteroides repeat domain, partial [Bifidobacterium margollesii]
MSAGNPIHLSKLWKLSIGAVASVAILLPMGAVANAAEKSAAPSATAPVATSTAAAKADGSASTATGNIPINAANFPDAKFRKYISSVIDKNHDGDLNATERNSVTVIEDWYDTTIGFESHLNSPIKSVEGIKFFPNLSELDFSISGQLTSLDVSHNPKLSKLDVSNDSSEDSGSHLTSLDVSHNPKLASLDVQGNRLTSLDVSHNPKLENLNVSDNRLTSLDVKHNSLMKFLEVSGNRFTSLDVSHNSKLEELSASGYNSNYKFSVIDVSRNPSLWLLAVSDNQLTRLDVSHNPKLKYLDIGNNRLTNVDLSHNAELYRLLVSGNQLYALDASSNQLDWVSVVSNNRLLAYRETTQNRKDNVHIDDQRTFPVDGRSLNLRRLIPWFDLSKVSNVKGGTISRAGVIAPVAGAKPGAVVSYDYAAGASGTLHASVSFTMKGEPAPAYRTVAFDSAGGSKVASQKVANGGKVKQPTNPTRSGYTFAGWYYGNAKWDFNRGVTANITLTAKWTKNTAPAQPTVKRVPVYRVYNRNSGLHHYTTSAAERNMLVRLGWRDESRGASFVTVGRGTPGARPVYREYNRRSGNHNWTLNKREHD